MQTVSFFQTKEKRRKSCLRYHQEELWNQQRHVLSANRYQVRWLGSWDPVLDFSDIIVQRTSLIVKYFPSCIVLDYRVTLVASAQYLTPHLEWEMEGLYCWAQYSESQETDRAHGERSTEDFFLRNWTWNGTFDKSGESRRWLGINRRQLQCQ